MGLVRLEGEKTWSREGMAGHSLPRGYMVALPLGTSGQGGLAGQTGRQLQDLGPPS